MDHDEIEQAFDAENLEKVYHERIAKSRAIGKDGTRHPVFQQSLLKECELISKKSRAETYAFTNYREKLIARGAKRPPGKFLFPRCGIA
jgi:RNA-directed DNA polymerase